MLAEATAGGLEGASTRLATGRDSHQTLEVRAAGERRSHMAEMKCRTPKGSDAESEGRGQAMLGLDRAEAAEARRSIRRQISSALVPVSPYLRA
jgi:hypothetical protein